MAIEPLKQIVLARLAGLPAAVARGLMAIEPLKPFGRIMSSAPR